jgi:hypothetical protein
MSCWELIWATLVAIISNNIYHFYTSEMTEQTSFDFTNSLTVLKMFEKKVPLSGLSGVCNV